MANNTAVIWVVAIIAVLAMGMFIQKNYEIFSISEDTSIHRPCEDVIQDSTYGAIAGECFLSTLSNVDRVMFVKSVSEKTNSDGVTCTIDITQPSDSYVCSVVKTAWGPTPFCNSNSDCSNTICVNHYCSNRPTQQCTYPSKKCSVTGGRQECLSNGLWSGNIPCEQGFSCSLGDCVKGCSESDWTYSLSPVNCPSNGKQTKTWTKLSSCSGGIQHTSEIISCNYQAPTCDNFNYTGWNACTSSGIQTRTVIASYPSNCQGGNPIITQSCTYIPSCTESNWQSSISPLTCPSSGIQTRTWTKVGNCEGGVSHQTESIECEYPSSTLVCTDFTYTDFTSCQSSNVKTRDVVTKSPLGCIGGNPLLSESCVYISDDPSSTPVDMTFWEQYMWWIIGGGVGLLLLVVLLNKK